MSASLQYLATTGTPDEVAPLLAELFGVAPADGEMLPFAELYCFAPDEYALEVDREEFGLVPSVIVRFAKYIEADVPTIRRVVALMASRFPGDAVVVFNGEEVVWERRDGVVTARWAWLLG